MALVLNLTKLGFFDKTGCWDQNLSQLWAAPHWPTRHRDQLVTDYRSPLTRSAAFVLPGFRSLDRNLIFQVLVLLGHVLLCLCSSVQTSAKVVPFCGCPVEVDWDSEREYLTVGQGRPLSK